MYTVVLPHEASTRCACAERSRPFIAPALDLLFDLVRDLFGELLGLLLGLSAELLGLVDDGVGAFLGLLCGLTELALDGGKAILCLELESLLTATHAVRQLAICFNEHDWELHSKLSSNMAGVYVLPVLDVTVTLGSLCAKVDHVASEEEVVSRLNSHGVAHESSAVTDKSCGHGTGDTVVETFVSFHIPR